ARTPVCRAARTPFRGDAPLDAGRATDGLAFVPEGLRAKVARNSELRCHQRRPGQEPVDHCKGFVLDFVGIELRLLGVSQEVAESIAERADTLQELGGNPPRGQADDLGADGPGPEPGVLRRRPLHEVFKRVYGLTRAALHDQGDEALAGPPDLPDETG